MICKRFFIFNIVFQLFYDAKNINWYYNVMHYKSPVFLIRTHSVFVPPFRWCISGYQCKWRKAQALVWLPQKQGQKNWTLAHVDQWITWFIKWLNTHNPSSNLFAGCTRTPASSPSSPPRSSSLGRPRVARIDLRRLSLGIHSISSPQGWV